MNMYIQLFNTYIKKINIVIIKIKNKNENTHILQIVPQALTSYVNVHIIFIFNSYGLIPQKSFRCHLGCLTCIATQKLNNFSHVF